MDHLDGEDEGCGTLCGLNSDESFRKATDSLIEEGNGNSDGNKAVHQSEEDLKISKDNREFSSHNFDGPKCYISMGIEEGENRRQEIEAECCSRMLPEHLVQDKLAERLCDNLGAKNEKECGEMDGTSNINAKENKAVNGLPEEQMLEVACSYLRRMFNDWRNLDPDRCVSASAKGFAIGAGIKGGLALVGILVKLKKRSSSTRMVGIKTNRDAISTAFKETLRYGFFLGTFAGTFASVDEAIAAFGGRARHGTLPPHALLLQLN